MTEPPAWYDTELKTYQRDRQEGGELYRRFEDRDRQQQSEAGETLIRKKSQLETETEWQRQVRSKKGDDYYKNLKEVRDRWRRCASTRRLMSRRSVGGYAGVEGDQDARVVPPVRHPRREGRQEFRHQRNGTEL